MNRHTFAQSLRPPPRLSLSEWADRYAVLSAESAAEPGRWRTLPYQRGILDAITDPRIERVSVMKSSRVGYSKCLNHAIGYHVVHDPCPVMLVQPTLSDAEGYSKDEIAPMLRDTPVLAGLFEEAGKRNSANTILRKEFAGGQVLLVGADSPRGFRRVSIRVVLFDEVDGYAQGAGDEGDQLRLGERRTEYYWNRKLVYGSTPTLEAISRIKRMFDRGDQRLYFVPCPDCKQPQALKWENLRWPKGDPDRAAFVCIHCGVVIEHRWQRWMIEEAARLQWSGEPGFGWVATNPKPEPRHASFHLWAAYSYSPNATWPQLAREWMVSHKNQLERITFVNTVLGLPFRGDGDAPDWSRLYERRSDYPVGVVPDGGLILFAGADVQKDRIEVEVVAYGRRMQSWSVVYRVYQGDTSQLDGPGSPWRQLDELLGEVFPHAVGGTGLRVQRLAVDAGYNTNTVYQWVRRQAANRVIAVDGRDTYQMIIGQPKAVEFTERGRRKSRSVKLWPVGSSLAKTELYGWLKQVKTSEDVPFGWCNFPAYNDEYFRQLTAEEIVPRLVKGFRKLHWEKVYNRNEALDCRVYARAAAALEGIDRWTDEQWGEQADELGHAAQSAATDDPLIALRPKVTRAEDPYL